MENNSLSEPWAVPTNDEDPASIRDALWECVAGPGVRHVRRIVACVNACQGIPDPAAALQQAREALAHFAMFIGHPNPDKREKKDCELRAKAVSAFCALEGAP